MSYELIKRWLDDASSVTTEEIDQAEQSLMERMQQETTGPNMCLLSCLSMMQDSDASELTASITGRIKKYEQEINW